MLLLSFRTTYLALPLRRDAAAAAASSLRTNKFSQRFRSTMTVPPMPSWCPVGGGQGTEGREDFVSSFQKPLPSHPGIRYDENDSNSSPQHPYLQHKERSYRTVQIRGFHSTSQPQIAPFLPEIVIATGIIGGWVAYRVGQGKPLTPDDALDVQEAYRKQEEDLRKRQKNWRESSRNRNGQQQPSRQCSTSYETSKE